MRYFEKLGSSYYYSDKKVLEEYDSKNFNKNKYKKVLLNAIDRDIVTRDKYLLDNNKRSGTKQTTSEYKNEIGARVIAGGIAGGIGGGILGSIVGKKATLPAAGLGALLLGGGLALNRTSKGKSTFKYKDPSKDFYLTQLKDDKKNINNLIKEDMKYLKKQAKAESKSQRRFFGMVSAAQKGELKMKQLPKSLRKRLSRTANSMSEKKVDTYAKTKHKGLPEKKAAVETTQTTQALSSGTFKLKKDFTGQKQEPLKLTKTFPKDKNISPGSSPASYGIKTAGVKIADMIFGKQSDGNIVSAGLFIGTETDHKRKSKELSEIIRKHKSLRKSREVYKKRYPKDYTTLSFKFSKDKVDRPRIFLRLGKAGGHGQTSFYSEVARGRYDNELKKGEKIYS